MCLAVVTRIWFNAVIILIISRFQLLQFHNWTVLATKCPMLYGRFDFAYDGQIKMLEYNADTPQD